MEIKNQTLEETSEELKEFFMTVQDGEPEQIFPVGGELVCTYDEEGARRVRAGKFDPLRNGINDGLMISYYPHQREFSIRSIENIHSAEEYFKVPESYGETLI